ncbi:MAG: RNA polymerase factor sigma-54 [Acidobacteriota bacterium]
MNAPVIRMEHRQSQTLTPRLQQAVRLLQLSSLDFAQEIREAMGKNPFLEHEEATEGPEEAMPAQISPAGGEVAETPAMPEAAESLSMASTSDADSDAWERDSWQQTGGGSKNYSGDSDTSVIDMVAADTDLRQHLHGQANLPFLSARDRALVGCVIESLDDDGYLRTDLRELACLSELDPAVEDAEINMAIKLVQSMEPSGVAARSIGECLLLQLNLIEDPVQRQLAAEIITHHLDKLAHRDCTGLAKTLNRDLGLVEIVCERIRHMDPRPGWRYGAGNVQYVVPDVIAKKVKGKWMAVLNPAVVPRIRLNQVYADLFRRHREGQHSELAAHLQEARWTVRNVEQRFATILSVANEILVRQHHFLEFGPLAMKPLGLKEIAEKVGLHESTVSRVTNNKYMATPSGVFELKFFFSRAMPTLSGGACSATAIRGLIKDMIEGEDEAHPLSDAEIARQLARQGLTVARRTVTKYRQQLKVPAVELRRCHA